MRSHFGDGPCDRHENRAAAPARAPSSGRGRWRTGAAKPAPVARIAPPPPAFSGLTPPPPRRRPLPPPPASESTRVLPAAPRLGAGGLKSSRFSLQGEEPTFALSDGSYGVGRLPGMSVVPRATPISRRHAVLGICDREVLLEDLGAATGPSSTGKRSPGLPRRLVNGDRVESGDLRFTFGIDGEGKREEKPKPRIVRAARQAGGAASSSIFAWAGGPKVGEEGRRDRVELVLRNRGGSGKRNVDARDLLGQESGRPGVVAPGHEAAPPPAVHQAQGHGLSGLRRPGEAEAGEPGAHRRRQGLAGGRRRRGALSLREPLQAVVGRVLEALRERRVVEDGVDEGVDRASRGQHEHRDVDELRGVLAEDVGRELVGLRVEQKLDQAVGVSGDLAARVVLEPGVPDLVGDPVRLQLLLGRTDRRDLGDRVDPVRLKRRDAGLVRDLKAWHIATRPCSIEVEASAGKPMTSPAA